MYLFKIVDLLLAAIPKYWEITNTVIRNRMHYNDLSDKDEQLLEQYRECTFKVSKFNLLL